MEQLTITGVAAQKKVALVELTITSEGDVSSYLLGKIAEAGINIKLMTSNTHLNNTAFFAAVIDLNDSPAFHQVVNEFKKHYEVQDFVLNKHVAKVSVVGYGIAEKKGVAYQVFEILSQNEIAILLTSTSEIKISVLVPQTQVQKAVSEIHKGFGLETTRANTQPVGVDILNS